MQLEQPTTSSIFNFENSVFNKDSFLTDPRSIGCCCINSHFKYFYHGHVVTSNLKFAKDNKLRKLLTEGINYRGPGKINPEQAKESIIKGMEDCISRRSQKHRIPMEIVKTLKLSKCKTLKSPNKALFT